MLQSGQLGLPAFDDLPALSATDLAEIEAETDRVLADLLTKHLLSAATVRSYASALRYWDAWHRAAFGTQLPLLGSPRAAVSAKAVCAFVAHHSPLEAGGVLRMAMPQIVHARLNAIGAIGRRQVANRRGKGKVEKDVPSLATIKHRIAALSACHGLAGMKAAYADTPEVKLALRGLENWVSASATKMLRLPKAPLVRDLFEAILSNCLRDGLRGVRDAALLHAAFHGGGRRRSEIASMRWTDLEPVQPRSDESPSKVYVWHLSKAKGRRAKRADQGLMVIRLSGPAAAAIDRWRDVAIAHGLRSDGPVWYRVSPSSDGDGAWLPTTPIIGEDVRKIVRLRAAEIGLSASDFGGHSLRSGTATTFLNEGGRLNDASDLLGHTKIETTREYYDQRHSPDSALARLISRHKEPT